MKHTLTIIILLLIISSESFSADLHASDINASSCIDDISLIVVSIVSFLTVIMGSRKVLRFIG